MNNFSKNPHPDVPLRWVRRGLNIPGYFRPKDSLNDGLRVSRAIMRLSRDRWLSGQEVIDFAHKFARCSNSGNPYTTAQNSLPGEAFYTGLLRGNIVVWPFDDERVPLLRKLQKIEKKPHRGIEAEMAILLYQCKRKN